MSATGVENIGGGRTPLPGTRGTDQWPMVSPLLLLSDIDSLLCYTLSIKHIGSCLVLHHQDYVLCYVDVVDMLKPRT